MATIYSIQRQSFQSLYEKYQDAGSPYLESMQRLEEKMDRPSSTFWLICVGEQVIGFSRVLVNDGKKEAWLGTTAILPEFQKNGYGYAAIELIEQHYPSVEKWSLDTILQESHLVHLYKKLGYIACQTKAVQEGMDLVFMEKVLV